MSELSFGKLIVPALLTTGAVFTALSAPVVMFAETPLSITQGNVSQGKSQKLYDGPVRGAALPYLVLAGATSVGLGISGVAMAGWRKSSKQAAALSEAAEGQQQRRLEREAHLKATLASEAYLAKSGLDFFLEDGELTPFAPETFSIAQALPSPVHSEAVSNPAARSQAPIEWPQRSSERPILHEVPRSQPIEAMDMMAQLAWLDGEESERMIAADHSPAIAPPVALPVAPVVPPARPQPQVAPLTAAQGFYGFTRGQAGSMKPSPATGQMAVQDQMTIARIQSLQTQLQAIVTQIESLQANLPTHPPTMQIVEEVSSAQSGLVQQEFKPQSQVVRRVAS